MLITSKMKEFVAYPTTELFPSGDRICLVGADVECSNSVGCRISGKGFPLVCLVAKNCDTVEIGDILLPIWVFDFTGIKPGTSIDVEFVSALQIPSDSNVQLSFLGFYQNIPWDECSGFFTPRNVLLCHWPSGIGKDSLKKMMHLYLQGCLLLNDAVVALQVLDCIMVFRSSLQDDTNLYLIPVGRVNIRIELLYLDNSRVENSVASGRSSNSLSPSSTLKCPLYLEKQIEAVFSMIIGHRGNSRLLPSSVLFSGLPGSGKSTLLQLIRSKLTQSTNHNKASHHIVSNKDEQDVGSVEVQYFSCSATIADTSTETEESLFTSDSVSAIQEIEQTVGALSKYFRCSRTHSIDSNNNNNNNSSSNNNYNNNISCGRNSLLVLLLDDLDNLLEVTEDSDESSKIPKALLRNLLNRISSKTVQSQQQQGDAGDGIGERTVVVVGTSSMLPSALRRYHEGYPDFELVRLIGRPTHQDRHDMVRAKLQQMKKEKEVLFEVISDTVNFSSEGKTLDEMTESGDNVESWSQRLAALTAGYLPGDIEQLMKKLNMLHSASNTPETPDSLVLWKTALTALTNVPPRQLLNLQLGGNGVEVETSSKQRTWDDFGGYPQAKLVVQRILTSHKSNFSTTSSNSNSSSSRSNNWKMNAARGGVVLFGPSGCGKTFFASILAAEAKMNFVAIRSTDILSKYFGQTEESIRNIFQRARAAAPCLLFFDDFDAISIKRDSNDGDTTSDLNARILSTFLNELDGIVGTNTDNDNDSIPISSGNNTAFADDTRVLVVVACSRLNQLDDALIRPGRLQYHVELNYPSTTELEAILAIKLSKLPCSPDIEVSRIVESISRAAAARGKCLTGSDMDNLTRKAVYSAMREAVGDATTKTQLEKQLENCCAIDNQLIAEESHQPVQLSNVSVQSIKIHHFAEAILELGLDERDNEN